MAYDNDGRLGTIVTSGPGTGQPTVTLTYSYDPSGDVTSVKDSLSGSGAAGQGITSYVYDNALRLATVTQSFGGTVYAEVTMTYDAGGRLTREKRTQNAGLYGLNTTYTYDASNDLTAIYSWENHGTMNMTGLDSLGDTFNAAGQVTQWTDTFSGTTTNTYTYDADSQLTASGDSFTASYSYDLNGNRNSTGYTTGAGNELTNSPGVTYTYDNDGNMITATTGSGTTTYTYDYENRLTNVDIHGTMVGDVHLRCAGPPHRYRRQRHADLDGVQWQVCRRQSLRRLHGSGSLKMRYLDGLAVDELLAQTDSSGNIAVVFDRQSVGSVTDVVNVTGTDLDHIVYDPFGNIVTQTNATDGVRFGFAGMEYDSVTGLYYDHARYYDAVIGRFVSQDPMGFAAGDTNLYRYVGNEPTVDPDPSGLQSQWPLFTYPIVYLPQPEPGPDPVYKPFDIRDYLDKYPGAFDGPTSQSPINLLPPYLQNPLSIKNWI